MSMYRLLPMHQWDSAEEGLPFEIGGRTRWVATLYLAKLSAGGSVTVVLEKSPTLYDEDWTQLATFGAQSSAPAKVVLSAAKETPDFTITPWQDIYFRAYITSITGEAVLDVEITCPFVDAEQEADSADLLSKEVRTWQDGKSRIVEQAEWDVVSLLLLDPDTGRLDIDLTSVDSHAAIRREIADQADHLLRRAALGRSMEPSALVSLREMSRRIPGITTRLRPYRPPGTYIWRGR